MEHSPYFVRDLQPSLYVGRIQNKIKVNQHSFTYKNLEIQNKNNEEEKKIIINKIERLKSEVKELKASINSVKEVLNDGRTHEGKSENYRNTSIEENSQNDLLQQLETQIKAYENLLSQFSHPPTFEHEQEDPLLKQQENEKRMSIESFEPLTKDGTAKEEGGIEEDDSFEQHVEEDEENDPKLSFQDPPVLVRVDSETEKNSDPDSLPIFPVHLAEIENVEVSLDTIPIEITPEKTEIIQHHEDINQRIVQLEPTKSEQGLNQFFAMLPLNYPLRSILTNGTELYVTHFIKYEPSQQMVYFAAEDQFIPIKCNQINGIILGKGESDMFRSE